MYRGKKNTETEMRYVFRMERALVIYSYGGIESDIIGGGAFDQFKMYIIYSIYICIGHSKHLRIIYYAV